MVRVERVTAALGGTVTDLPGWVSGEPLRPDVAARLHELLMEHQVLVFPERTWTPTDLADLGRSFGDLAPRHHDYVTHPDDGDVVVLEWGGERRPDAAEWHADLTYRTEPPFASILEAVEVPRVGGDTLWASMYSVHDSLSEGLRSELAELSAVHDLGAFRGSSWLAGGQAALEDAIHRAGVAVHPIIAHHPVTGRPYLNVSESFTRWVIGHSAPESQRLLTMLFDAINRPDHHMRLRWRPGMVAIWDNRGTQHYAVADYLPHRRVMHRVAVATDRIGQRAPVASSGDSPVDS